MQGRRRCAAAKSTPEELGNGGGGDGWQPRSSEGGLSIWPGLLQSTGRGRHRTLIFLFITLLDCKVQITQLLAKHFRSREKNQTQPTMRKGR